MKSRNQISNPLQFIFGVVVLIVMSAMMIMMLMGDTLGYWIMYIFGHTLFVLILGVGVMRNGARDKTIWQAGGLQQMGRLFVAALGKLAPLYGLILLGLIVDGVAHTKIASNPVVFFLTFPVGVYLINRWAWRDNASGTLRTAKRSNRKGQATDAAPDAATRYDSAERPTAPVVDYSAAERPLIDQPVHKIAEEIYKPAPEPVRVSTEGPTLRPDLPGPTGWDDNK